MEDSLFGIISAGITGIVTFFIGQAKAKKEIESLQLENIETSLDIYNKIINDLKEQVTELLAKVDELELKIEELMVENHELKQMLQDQKLKNKKN